MTLAAETCFFVHVMKTGGTTFVQHIEANFRPEQMYPGVERGAERRRAYYMIDELRALPEERRRAIKAYVGHFPFVASTLVGNPVTFTILREPIERTVSVLRHCKRHVDRLRDRSLEEIYEDGYVFPMQIRNYQAKQFAMTRDDKLESHFDVIEVDDARLEIARNNLERVDVLGLHEHYDEFVEAIQHRFGWNCGPVANMRVSTDDWDVSSEFRQRIASDNAAELSFYEYARRLHERRRTAP